MLYVSLGAWCQVAQQLKNHVPDKLVNSALDWTVSSLKSITRIIETNGDNFCEGLTISKPANSMTCETYGILYHHEFKRDDNNNPFTTEETLADAKSKLTHKYKSMSARIQESDECVTFVRFGGHAQPLVAWPYAKDHAEVSSQDLNEIAITIEKAFPRLAFRILFVSCPTSHFFRVNEAKLDPRIWTVEIQHRHGVDWTGSNDDWSEVIARIPESFEKLTAESPREASPFKDIEEHFKLLDVFSKDQINAIKNIINKEKNLTEQQKNKL